MCRILIRFYNSLQSSLTKMSVIDDKINEKDSVSNKRNLKPYRASIIVTSDTCYEDESKDESGSYVMRMLQDRPTLFSRVTKLFVKDDQKDIVNCLMKCLKEEDPALIISIGGTGLCPRDVTPEAISPLYDKNCTGIVAALHMASLRYSPHASLSRLTSGIIGDCLIVNFPGSLKACRDCFVCLDCFLEHALEQVRFNAKSYNETHLRSRELSTRTLQKPDVQSLEDTLRPIVVPQAGDSSVPQKRTINVKKKYFVRNRVKLTKKDADSALNHKVAEQLSRLTIKDVQESRNMQQTNKIGENQDGTRTLGKKPVVFKNKSAVPEIDKQEAHASKQPQAIQKLPLEKVPRTQSNYAMIEYTDALDILARFSIDLLCECEDIVLNTFDSGFKLIGRMLANNLKSTRLIPPYAVSTIDGYVLNIPPPLRKATATIINIHPAKLLGDLSEFKSYQRHPQHAQTSFCYPINTGAKLPEKNFAVIPIEKTNLTAEGSVAIFEANLGQHLRRPGSDLNVNESLAKGTTIGVIELSLIISMGIKKLKVFKQPRIGVLSTGDEIINFFSQQEISNEDVVDINGPLLTSLFRLRGYFTENLGIVRDDPNLIMANITSALKKLDVLIITGGASMGTKDHVKDTIEKLGGKIHFGRVNIKPGKPAAFASIVVNDKRKFIFSLPGNPVSAYMTSILLVMPFIEHGTKDIFKINRKLSINSLGLCIQVTVVDIIGEPYEFDDRLEFVRAKLISQLPEYTVRVSMEQQSSRILSLKDYDCLIMIGHSLKGSKFETGRSYPAIKIQRPL